MVSVHGILTLFASVLLLTLNIKKPLNEKFFVFWPALSYTYEDHKKNDAVTDPHICLHIVCFIDIRDCYHHRNGDS